jgi:putative methyltransferase (TIGR04325 family)
MRVGLRWRVSRKFFEHLVGYRRIFDSMTEARTVAARHLEESHDCLDNINRQISLSRSARPSDYPVLFYLDRLSPVASSLFDLGGNVGNLFYSYSKYLAFPGDFVWTVYDMERTLELGRQLAHERGEKRLRFTADLEGLDGHDVLLVSGALHYVESPLPDVLRRLSSKPSHVFINRTPMTNVRSVVTVQDAGDSLFACKIILRQELIAGMEKIGYVLVDQWSVPELSVHIPFYPEYSVSHYTGLYFQLS